MEIRKVTCIRCNGSGAANPYTWPDQAGKGGCRLCQGTGQQTVAVCEPEEHRKKFHLDKV